MAKIPEAQKRLFKNVFVCKSCRAKVRANPIRVLEGKIRCRKCKRNALRPLKKK